MKNENKNFKCNDYIENKITCITKKVEKEIISCSFSETGEIKIGICKWIEVLEARTTGYKVFEGIGSGEKSILSYAMGEKTYCPYLTR